MTVFEIMKDAILPVQELSMAGNAQLFCQVLLYASLNAEMD